MTESFTEPIIGNEQALWTSVLGAPAVWALQLQVGYALTPAVCHIGVEWPLHLLNIICVMLAGTAVFPSFYQWKGSGGGSPDVTDGGPAARRRFLGALGMIVSLTFLVVIVAQALAALFFNPCWS